MRLALLLISLFSCLAAKLSGPASYFKPNFGAEDREKLEKKLEELKAARAAKEAAKAAEKAGAGAGAPGPPDTDADTAPPPPETDGADGAVDLRQRVASWRQRSAVAMSGVLSRSRRLRAPAAVVLALGWWRRPLRWRRQKELLPPSLLPAAPTPCQRSASLRCRRLP